MLAEIANMAATILPSPPATGPFQKMSEKLQCCDKSGREAYKILGYFIVGVGAGVFIFSFFCQFLFYFIFLSLARSRYACTEYVHTDYIQYHVAFLAQYLPLQTL